MSAMKDAGDRLGERMRALGQPWELALFLWVPFLIFAVVLAWTCTFTVVGRGLGDLPRGGALGAPRPFAVSRPWIVHALAHNDRFVYPPITALLVAPFAVLPDEVGRVLVILLCSYACRSRCGC